jgi:hypothetical protein
MAMPPPPTTTFDVREAIIDANRLIGILQGTMSLEGQGLNGRKLREIKKQMIRRLLQVA